MIYAKLIDIKKNCKELGILIGIAKKERDIDTIIDLITSARALKRRYNYILINYKG